MQRRRLSRRVFLKSATISMSGWALAACVMPSTQSPDAAAETFLAHNDALPKQSPTDSPTAIWQTRAAALDETMRRLEERCYQISRPVAEGGLDITDDDRIGTTWALLQNLPTLAVDSSVFSSRNFKKNPDDFCHPLL